MRLLVQAIDALFVASGGQGIFLDSRCSGSGATPTPPPPISASIGMHGSMYGRHPFGLEPKGQY